MAFLEATPGGVFRILVPAIIVVEIALGGLAVLDHMSGDRRAAEHRALAGRQDELTARALVPGSALSCVDALAGDATETACEAQVFGSPQSTAAAVAYVGARLSLLADAKDKDAPQARFAAVRRAIELDRFGIAAHVLSERDGCSAAQCTGFALVGDSSLLRSNLKARTFDQYVSRHAPNWTAPAPQTPQVPPPPAMSQVPAAVAPLASASPPSQAAVAPGRPVSSKYDFPSAASIPPVSIMNAEPALPKEAAASQAAAPSAAAPPPPERTPVPPRRPQTANEPADTAAPR